MKERRKQTRVQFYQQIDIVLPSGKQDTAIITDISTGGIKMFMPEQFLLGSRHEILLEVPLHGKYDVVVNCQTMYTYYDKNEKKFAMGLEFLNIKKQDYVHLKRYISKRIKEQKLAA